MKITSSASAIKALGTMSLLAITTSAHAETVPLDLTPLTDAFTAAPIVTALLAVAGVLAVIYAGLRGAKIVLALIR